LCANDCHKLLDADRRAMAAGLPFNRFITLLFQKCGTDPAANGKAASAFIKLAADWLRPFGYPLAWAWVQESSRKNGAHVHMVMHVPPALDVLFRPMPTRWAKAIIAGRYKKGAVETQRIVGARTIADDPAYYRANITRKLHYMLKAAPTPLADQYGLHLRNRRCRVIGKRLAVWQRRRWENPQVA
jgi:hypothetical protein